MNTLSKTKVFKKIVKLFKSNIQNEHGNTFILYVMSVPLLIACFAVGVDFTYAQYTRTTLQSALDTATQSAVSLSVNPGTGGNSANRPTLTSDQARASIIRLYDVNRRTSNKLPYLACQGSEVSYQTADGGIAVTPGSGCGFTQINYNYRSSSAGGDNYVTISVREQSQYLFLQFLGMDYQTYELSSSARLSRSLQAG